MTDVAESRDQAGAELSAADEQVLRELTERARSGGLKLTGEGGLLGRLTKMVVEGALEGELDDYLGYGKHDPEGRDGGNSRNGYRAKTVLTGTGPVEISVPRDRDSSSGPGIVAKRQRRLTGADDMVISLPAEGLAHGGIAAHLAGVYGAEVSRQAITAITDRVMEGMAEWQYAPERDWAQIARDLKPVYTAASESEALGRSAGFAGKWEKRYPAIIRLRENTWAESVPFLRSGREIRTVICTANAIESINARLRRAVNTRGNFPAGQAAMKCLNLAIMSPAPAGKGRQRWTNRWKAALNAFDMT